MCHAAGLFTGPRHWPVGAPDRARCRDRPRHERRRAGDLQSRQRRQRHGAFSGAASLRGHASVFTIRATHKAEIAKIVETKRTVGATKAMVIHQDDKTGLALYETAAAVFAEAGLPKPRAVALKAHGRLDRAAVDLIAKESPHYLLVTMPFGVARDFLTLAADHGLAIPVVAQVVPSPKTTNQALVPVVKACADALAGLNGRTLNATSLDVVHCGQGTVDGAQEGRPQPDARKPAAGSGRTGPHGCGRLCAELLRRQPPWQPVGGPDHGVTRLAVREVGFKGHNIGLYRAHSGVPPSLRKRNPPRPSPPHCAPT
jgi:hypothetical protein